MPRGAKPKVWPPEQVELVRSLYERGHTQVEIAAQLSVTQKIVWNLMRCNGLKARVAAKRIQDGSSNHMWKGDAAGYQALHLRVERARGKPSRCQRCGASDDQRIYEWANLSGRYEDVDDYERMCRSCHRRYDNGRRH